MLFQLSQAPANAHRGNFRRNPSLSAPNKRDSIDQNTYSGHKNISGKILTFILKAVTFKKLGAFIMAGHSPLPARHGKELLSPMTGTTTTPPTSSRHGTQAKKHREDPLCGNINLLFI